jgi:hypothetical protein
MTIYSLNHQDKVLQRGILKLSLNGRFPILKREPRQVQTRLNVFWLFWMSEQEKSIIKKRSVGNLKESGIDRGRVL